MCEPTTLAIAAATVAGGVSVYGQYQQGQVQKQVGRNNQIMAEYAAQDAQRRAGETSIKALQRARQIKGAQRASLAAKGLDLGVGTAADLQDQTDFFGATDAATARDNGNREAWSLRGQGANARAAGDAAASQSNLGAFSTILATGGQVAGKWDSFTGGGDAARWRASSFNNSSNYG